MPIELGEKISEGAGHRVYSKPNAPGVLIKVPKSRRADYDETLRDLEAADKYFGPWIPETTIHADGNGYYLEQQYLADAAHIKPADVEAGAIADEMREILEANQKAMQDGKVGLDFLGYEGSAKLWLARWKKFKGTMIDSRIITPALKLARAAEPDGVPGKCLEWWNDPNLSAEITNLVIGTRENTNRQIAVVDLSLLQFGADSMLESARAKFLQHWNREYLRSDFGLKLN